MRKNYNVTNYRWFSDAYVRRCVFNGQRINDVPSYKRKINTVFQRYALFPHLDVYDNIAFGLRLAKLSEEEIDDRVTEMLEIVSLKGFETGVSLPFPAVSSSVSPSRARLSTARRCCCSTSLWALWTFACARICRTSLRTSSSAWALRLSMSRTIRKKR